MKYLKKYRLFESVNEEEIHDICKEYDIRNYTINDDGTIDVNGSVDLSKRGLTKLPIRFNHVSGYFYCNNNQLTSLEGAPKSVDGHFTCINNKLTSLRGVPQSIGGDFWCRYNQLTSLRGAPQIVIGSFLCEDNQITSLDGAPQSIGGNFYCDVNQITSLKGLEFKSFNYIDLESNPIYTIVKNWINKGNREDLIEYFVDMDIIQEGEDKPKLIMMRLEAFYEDIGLEMDIDWEEVKKYYEIIE
jgi:hypothetical protein